MLWNLCLQGLTQAQDSGFMEELSTFHKQSPWGIYADPPTSQGGQLTWGKVLVLHWFYFWLVALVLLAICSEHFHYTKVDLQTKKCLFCFVVLKDFTNTESIEWTLMLRVGWDDMEGLGHRKAKEGLDNNTSKGWVLSWEGENFEIYIWPLSILELILLRIFCHSLPFMLQTEHFWQKKFPVRSTFSMQSTAFPHIFQYSLHFQSSVAHWHLQKVLIEVWMPKPLWD